MKQITSFGDNVQLVEKSEIDEKNVTRGGANSGLPNFAFAVMPLFGEITFSINNVDTTVTGVCVGYFDRNKKASYRMVSINSFNRTAKSAIELNFVDIQNIEGFLKINEVATSYKPTEIISMAKNTIFSEGELKNAFVGVFKDGALDWNDPKAVKFTVRKAVKKENEYNELLKEFTKFAKDEQLTESVNEIAKIAGVEMPKAEKEKKAEKAEKE